MSMAYRAQLELHHSSITNVLHIRTMTYNRCVCQRLKGVSIYAGLKYSSRGIRHDPFFWVNVLLTNIWISSNYFETQMWIWIHSENLSRHDMTNIEEKLNIVYVSLMRSKYDSFPINYFKNKLIYRVPLRQCCSNHRYLALAYLFHYSLHKITGHDAVCMRHKQHNIIWKYVL